MWLVNRPCSSSSFQVVGLSSEILVVVFCRTLRLVRQLRIQSSGDHPGTASSDAAATSSSFLEGRRGASLPSWVRFHTSLLVGFMTSGIRSLRDVRGAVQLDVGLTHGEPAGFKFFASDEPLINCRSNYLLGGVLTVILTVEHGVVVIGVLHGVGTSETFAPATFNTSYGALQAATFRPFGGTTTATAIPSSLSRFGVGPPASASLSSVDDTVDVVHGDTFCTAAITTSACVAEPFATWWLSFSAPYRAWSSAALNSIPRCRGDGGSKPAVSSCHASTECTY